MDFNETVWEACKKVPWGRVTTYGEIARFLGSGAYQAVGNALNKNPFSVVSCNDERMVPCHRVVNSDGSVGGFALGQETKVMILKREGVEIVDGKVKDFEEKLFRF